MVLIGLDNIGAAFGKSRWTIKRWAREHRFPIARLPDGKWCVTPTLIDAWLLARNEVDPFAQPVQNTKRKTNPLRGRARLLAERSQQMPHNATVVRHAHADPQLGSPEDTEAKAERAALELKDRG